MTLRERITHWVELTQATKYTTAILSIVVFWGLIDNWDNEGCLSIAEYALLATTQAMFCCLLTQNRNKTIRIIGYTFITFLCLFSFITIVCYHFWQWGINSRLIYIVTETNSNEAIEFIQTITEQMPSFFCSWHFVGLVVAIIIVSVLVHFTSDKIYGNIAIATFGVGIVCSITYIAINIQNRTNISLLLRVPCRIVAYFYDMQGYEEKEYIYNNQHDISLITSAQLADVVVMIIGESSNPTHWSLYGYKLNTTPQLDKMASDIAIYTDVIPSYGTTAMALRNMLFTYNTSTTDKLWHETIDIISLMKNSGYQTAWISNQGIVGNHGYTKLISDRADYCIYIGAITDNDNTMKMYDLQTKPYIVDFLEENKKSFVIVHTLGSHIIYSRRYPSDFDIFTSADIPNNNLTYWQKRTVAEYDNSILYTDNVIASTISVLQADTTHTTLLLYLSDHSEDVYDTSTNYYGHATRPNQQIHIPMIIWANDKYKQQNPTIWNNLLQNANKAYNSENVIHTIMGTTGTNYQWYNAQQDLSSDSFCVQHRYFEEKLFD